ncbi:hypothetical protein ACF1CG_29315 [Streptomyces sp. NPDC014773]|uniref:hypothetical protein n=1 Tax=Streptomyces sp. NPDC014773 TaxID=3364908 RepID=UPI0036FED2DD
MDDAEFVAVVRRGDAEAVAAPLEAGAPPDTMTDDGLPVLCLAVAACDAAVAHSAAGHPEEVADALAALLDEDDSETRLNAAFGLLRSNDPRTGEAIGRVGRPPHPAYEHDHRLSAFYEWEREEGSRAAE